MKLVGVPKKERKVNPRLVVGGELSLAAEDEPRWS